MTDFFKVKSLEQVWDGIDTFSPVETEQVGVDTAFSRVLARDLTAGENLPGFRRATMDGYAVAAAATFGASDASPAWLQIEGAIAMGEVPDFGIKPGQAARIATGGMLPQGADSVVMIEHTEAVDDRSVEIYKSVAPLSHVIDASEDVEKGQVVLTAGSLIRPQEQGLAAGLGISRVDVFKKPRVGIISTGDEVVPIDQATGPGRVRDINSYTLSGFVKEAGGEPVFLGIVKDDPDELQAGVENALDQTDMVLISGGSSVGTKDFTVDVLSRLPETRIMVHGISISPGKPTILASAGGKPVWGLPGQVTSAMVVFKIVVTPFLDQLKGLDRKDRFTRIPARLSRNVSSAQGRRDFVRVGLTMTRDGFEATPIMGKSGLIRTMIQADGLLEISDHLEGLEQGSQVDIILLQGGRS